MRQHPYRLARFVIVLSICASSVFAATTLRPKGTSVSGEVLVKIQASASANDISSIETAADIDQGDRIATLKSGTIWRFHSSSRSTEALAGALQNSPNVIYVEPNYIWHATDTPNDTSYAQLWGLKNAGQTIGGSPGIAGADISAEAAWSVTTGSASIVIGVVDTGVDYTHPDLAANIWNNPGGKGNVLCAAGTHGFNAITRTCDPRDDHYHGTHVSGTIGAVGNNALGVTGVNWTTSIMGLKFLDSSGSGTTANAIAAIDFAVQAKLDGVNVRILSNSWGGGEFSKALLDEINKANENDILFVAAAGNSSSNTDTYPQYPSSYNTANMIAVAATDNRDALAYFSNFGLTSVHLGAPGVDVLSCYPGTTYTTLSGTSMATPHVAGVAGLVLAKTPALTTAQVKSAILNNIDPIASLSGKTITGGRLNAAKAVGAPLGPDFTLLVNPVSRSVGQGTATTYTVTVTPANGFSGSVNLAVTGLPSGASGTFSPNPATTTTTLSITTTGSTPLGSYSLTITGTSGAITHSTSATLVMLVKPPTTACPSFSSPLNYYLGGYASTLATADFNRDGKADVVLAMTSNQIRVLSGQGDGTFQSGFTYNAGSAIVAIATGDFNGDGKPDIAAANAISNTVSVLLGNGDGTMQPAVTYATGSNPFSLIAGDFNGDGKADLAVANNGSNSISILTGNGDGTFQAALSYAAGSGPFWVSAGDLNGDGKTDLVVADYNTNNLSVLLGNGDGTLQAPVAYTAGTGPSSIAIGDFNGDGKLDLAASNDVSNNVSIMAGIGDGTFGAAVNYAVPAGIHSVAIADTNGDGKADLAISNATANSVSILTGRGDGTFAAAVNYAVGGPNQVITADFNGDGRTDLAVTVSDYYFFTLLNNGVCALNCNTIAPAANYAASTTPQSVAVGDLNGDGKPDLVTANSGANNVSIELGVGDGTFVPSGTYNTGSAPNAVTVGDFNRDGRLDLATANSGSNDVSILLGNGNGTFQTQVPYGAATNPHSLFAGDFNRDGKLDLAVANYGSNNVSILLGSGTGTFLAAVNYSTGSSPESVAAADFNRDGKLDLAVANSGSNNVSLLNGNGDGTFLAATNTNAGTSPFAVLVSDFNRDGKPDLAVANSGSNNVSILLGNGAGALLAAVNYAAGTNPHGVKAGDFDDDGKLDLAVTNSGSNNVSFLPGNSNGTFGAAVNIAVGTNPGGIIVRDLNRDGKPDIAVANSGSSDVSILLNTCPAPDLSITKTHSGSFTQGDTGKTYTITVSNVGNAPADGSSVSVVDTIPVGLNATALGGTGWTCVLSTVTCTRSDVLAAGNSYEPITLTVRVANNAPATVTNTARVSGGGEVNTANSSTSDPATIAPLTDLLITSSHTGSFTQGDSGRIFRIVVRNAGGLPTTGSISVTDTLPTGLAATALTGNGWNCVLGTLTCTRSDVLTAATTYPAITLTVSVAANAPASVTNTATVSGGGESNTANDIATDPISIWSSQTCGSFGAPVSYTVGSAPYAVATGDFNHDGKADLVAANYYSAIISVLLGSGSGTFGAAVNYSVGQSPRAVAISDLNHDGNNDLVVANGSSGNISILIGNGDGTFASPVAYPTGDTPSSVVVSDFDGDGNADIAVVNFYSATISILIGNGDGSLRTAVNYSSPNYGLNSIASADFNGDGKPDLAVTSSNSSSFYVRLGNGDGTFQPAISYSAGGYNSSSIAAGDFNGDGNPDLAIANYYSGFVTILQGNANGSFLTIGTYATAYGSNSVAIEDLNGDGKADLALANTGSNSISVLLGNGNGTFQAATNYPSGGGPSHVAIGDFNGDGRADFAVAAFYDYKVNVMLGGCPDLTIVKSHSGNFSGGQTNATYSLVVSNSGGSTGGLVTVTDTLPSGMSATAMSGIGWSCDLPNVRCTRSDALLGGLSYPAITLTVSVSRTTAANVTNMANVSGGSENNTSNDSASDPTTIIQVPDLTITKTHDGSFAQGQTGRTYSISVANGGGAATSDTVTVIDLLPSGLTATAMAGPGWTCDLPSRTCTRTDPLPVDASYPAITLTVSVNGNAPATVANIAAVSGGGELLTTNDIASDPTSILATPTNLAAIAIAPTQVSLTWDPVGNATSFQVLRSSNNGPFVVVGAPFVNSFNDSSLTPNTTYLYRVRAVDASTTGSLSNLDLATTILFTDDPITVGSTFVKAVHFTELRTAVNAVRAAAGLPPATFSDTSLTAAAPRAVHVTELRSALDAARSILLLAPIAYTDPGLGTGLRIKAAHVRELRGAVK
ncbi:MAG: hypothetical protein QOC81_3060 [Thermoanaerobaculia bacterium]|jgi:uncharacterized repeat protein (TIGR01451 family)|nr:hypothetical protein [Thermoanaerobaculia bacterium]